MFLLSKYKPQGSLFQFYVTTKRDSCIYKRGVFSSARELIPHIPKAILFKLFLDQSRFKISQEGGGGEEIVNPVTRVLLT